MKMKHFCRNSLQWLKSCLHFGVKKGRGLPFLRGQDSAWDTAQHRASAQQRLIECMTTGSIMNQKVGVTPSNLHATGPRGGLSTLTLRHLSAEVGRISPSPWARGQQTLIPSSPPPLLPPRRLSPRAASVSSLCLLHSDAQNVVLELCSLSATGRRSWWPHPVSSTPDSSIHQLL